VSHPHRGGRVRAEGLQHECEIGFHPGEHGRTQTLEIDFEAVVDWSAAVADDDPSRLTLDYHVADQDIGVLLRSRRWNLVETVAEAVASLLIDRSGATRVRVCVRKRPLGMPHARAIAVECVREAPVAEAEP